MGKNWPPTAQLASVSPNDASLAMECAEAIGECAANLKCNDLDASKTCVLKKNNGCSASVFFQVAQAKIQKACGEKDSCNDDCQEAIKAEIKQAVTKVEETLKHMKPPTAPLASVATKDPSLEMACAEAIGKCAADLKCDDLDASKECVLKKNNGCSASVFFRKAVVEVNDACKKDSCGDACEEEIKNEIKKAVEKVEDMAKEMERWYPPTGPPTAFAPLVSWGEDDAQEEYENGYCMLAIKECAPLLDCNNFAPAQECVAKQNVCDPTFLGKKAEEIKQGCSESGDGKKKVQDEIDRRVGELKLRFVKEKLASETCKDAANQCDKIDAIEPCLENAGCGRPEMFAMLRYYCTP